MVSLVGSFHLLCEHWHVIAGFCCVATIHLASEGFVSTLREMFSDITGQWLLLLILKAPGSNLTTETTYRLRLLVIINPATERHFTSELFAHLLHESMGQFLWLFRTLRCCVAFCYT